MSEDRIDELDALLAMAPADVSDSGFSARVMARVTAIEARRSRIAMLIVALCVFVLVPFLPMREIGVAMLRAGPVLAGSAAFSIAIGVLILTFSLERRLRE